MTNHATAARNRISHAYTDGVKPSDVKGNFKKGCRRIFLPKYRLKAEDVVVFRDDEQCRRRRGRQVNDSCRHVGKEIFHFPMRNRLDGLRQKVMWEAMARRAVTGVFPCGTPTCYEF